MGTHPIFESDFDCLTDSVMRLRRFLLRYYPPGITIEYEKRGQTRTKDVNLFELTADDDPIKVAEQVINSEPLINEKKIDILTDMVRKLQSKMNEETEHKFNLVRVIKAHLLPITNVAFNKLSTLFATGSYDRTCKIFETASGKELFSLEGHQNVVYSVAFNNPKGTMLASGSFDKTAKIWSVQTGECLETFTGHSSEVVSVQFSPDSKYLATGSMDTTAKLWCLEKMKLLYTFDEHCGEIISLTFDTMVILYFLFDNILSLG